MARIDRHKQHQKGAVYHVFNRGVNKDNIFFDEQDYDFYLKKIRKYKRIYKIDFINYNLIPNHYHYTLQQLSDIPISKFIHSLHTSYGHYFNKKYQRVGPLFQDRYKQRLVADLKYFIWLSAYINGNAQIHKIVKNVKGWPYSSCLDYIGLRDGTICNKEIVLKNFKDVEEYEKYVKEVIIDCQQRKEALKEFEWE